MTERQRILHLAENSALLNNTERDTQIAKRNLSRFLIDVEKRAFRMAILAVNNEADALDIVQEAMIKLASHYLFKSENEWKPLFYRILQNKIMDWHRYQKVKRNLFFWQREDDFSEAEVLTKLHASSPESDILSTERQDAAIILLAQLPLKQQQCFLLRSWEGLSVRETAKAMNCTEGTVKTHFHRACAKLKVLVD